MDASYNNSFGQSDDGTSGTGMISSSDASGVGPVVSGDSGGDIIISSSDGSRDGKRRWPIVVAIVLFIVAIGAGVGAWILGMPNRGDDVGSTKIALNRLMNYVINGEASNDESDVVYDAGAKYYFITNQNTIEKQAELYAGVNNLLDDFVSKYDKAYINGLSEEKYNLLNDTVNDIKQLFDFMQEFYTKRPPTAIDIRNEYFANGRKLMIDLMNDYYDFDIENNKYVDGFYDAYEAWINNEADLLDLYVSFGCVVNNNVQYGCILEKGDEVTNQLQENEYYSQMLYNDLNNYYNRNYVFMNDVFLIDALLNDKSLGGLYVVGQNE